MATPVGHYLVGLSVAALLARDPAERRQAPWWALLACAPDLDVLPGLAVGNLSRFHHGVSHSLAAAGIVALATTALVAGRERPTLRVAIIAFAIVASHGVLDSFTVDTRPPVGIPFLWPWSQATFQAPWPLLPHVQHTQLPLVSAHNARLMVREALVLAPLVGLVVAGRSPARRWRRAVAWLCAVWLVAAAGLSFASIG